MANHDRLGWYLTCLYNNTFNLKEKTPVVDRSLYNKKRNSYVRQLKLLYPFLPLNLSNASTLCADLLRSQLLRKDVNLRSSGTANHILKMKQILENLSHVIRPDEDYEIHNKSGVKLVRLHHLVGSSHY